MKWHDDSAAFISMMVTPKTFSLAKSLRSSRILMASMVVSTGAPFSSRDNRNLISRPLV